MASYSTSASTSRSSRAGAGFDRDMQEFLLNVEVSAKQIIRVSCSFPSSRSLACLFCVSYIGAALCIGIHAWPFTNGYDNV